MGAADDGSPQAKKMKTGGVVAMTGASGIMGSRLYPALVEDGWKVIGISRGQGVSQGGPGRDGNNEVHSEFVNKVCDFADPASMESGVFDGCTHVLHLAAQGSPAASFEDILRSNIISTYHAYEAAKRSGVQRFVLASTNHVQHGDSMALGEGPGSIDHSRLKGRLMKLADPATPDSWYAASKLHNEDIGKMYAKVWKNFELVSLRIGWVLYDDPTELQGTKFEKYLRAMFLSRRDCIGFVKAALIAPIPPADDGYLCAYALSNNAERVFDLEETVAKLGYKPLDSAEDFSWGGKEKIDEAKDEKEVVSAATASHTKLNVFHRTAYVYSPKTGSATAAVLVLHGSGGEASDMFDLGFEALADTHGFYVVYPEMAVLRSDGWGYKHDIPYFSTLASRLRAPHFGIAADRIFICGHSAGGTMSTFLQNELDDFAAAGVVEAAVGDLDLWNMTRRGHRTVLVWNHADPVLREYAPNHDEMAYYNLTVQTLRRSATPQPDHIQPMPTGKIVTMAERLTFHETNAVPQLSVISWRTQPGRHEWPRFSWTETFDATVELIDFFLHHERHGLVV